MLQMCPRCAGHVLPGHGAGCRLGVCRGDPGADHTLLEAAPAGTLC